MVNTRYILFIFLNYCHLLYLYSCDVAVSTLLRSHRVKLLPVNPDESQRIVIRRKHVWADALHRFKTGLNVKQYIKITFVGEPAVDQGGPLREFFCILIGDIARNNNLFSGSEISRVPVHNMPELSKKTYYYIGSMLALSIIHGGPAPAFLATAVADYIVYGMVGVKATVHDIPDPTVKEKVLKVNIVGCSLILVCMSIIDPVNFTVLMLLGTKVLLLS